MRDHRALDAGAAKPTAPSDDRLVALASALEQAAEAYASTIDQMDGAGQAASDRPWMEEARGRMRSLLSECRAKADGLIDAQAETRAASAAKRKALLRYWEVDIDCDPRASRLLLAVCADFDRLEAQLGSDLPSSGRRRHSTRAGRHRDNGC